MHLTIMNKIIFLISVTAFCFNSPVFSQGKCPVKKVYAYKQASLPGVQPKKAEDGGSERKETFNYWFYLTLPDSKKIEITNIWISGEKFTAKAETVENSPVTKLINKSDSGNETFELVPKTKKKLMLVYPSGLNNETEVLSNRVQKKLDQNELVIGFTWKGKNRFAKMKVIKVLDPEALP